MTGTKGRRENGSSSFVRSAPAEEGLIQGNDIPKNEIIELAASIDRVPIEEIQRAQEAESRMPCGRPYNEFEKGQDIC